ncbi:MAG: response regulator [Deltaproteobacteria bacterium]|nr:response regulator [Deltaproteobacteria bacterium]
MAENNATNDQIGILVVEDSPTQAEQLRYILERHFYRVSMARNGQEALALLNQEKPTMVVSDVLMPVLDGYELCRRIRSDKNLRDLPVILLTSLSDPEDVVKGLECGADNFITKPYDPSYLLSRVEYMLANEHLRQYESTNMGVEVYFAGRKHFITSDRLQILNLLLSTYELAVQKNRELSTAQEELRSFNARLEEKVKERTIALESEVARRKQAEEEIRSLNAQLEQRVLGRTRQLEEANRELEAFSYSVSHDLRAPLRHIQGFTELLQENAVSSLDEKSRHYLRSIAESATHMNSLIDNLLAFSRLGHAEMQKTRVSLDQLVQEAVTELTHDDPERTILWDIQPLPEVEGDRFMLRLVLVNLISNALKFTRTRPESNIEIGTRTDQENEKVIFVRDNGVGFDMRYVDKLFGIFQRLHRAEEFEGTGVGLASVRRIIHRHGGRVWAEGSVDGGATFYFTLPTA